MPCTLGLISNATIANLTCSFLLATLISSLLSFLFWNVYEIWNVEFGELLLGVVMHHYPRLVCFFPSTQMNEGRKMQEEVPLLDTNLVSLFSYFSLLH